MSVPRMGNIVEVGARSVPLNFWLLVGALGCILSTDYDSQADNGI